MDIGNTLHTTKIGSPMHSVYESHINDLLNGKLNPTYYPNLNINDFHATPMNIRNYYGYFQDGFEVTINTIAYLSAYGSIPNGTSYYDALNTVRTTTAAQITFYHPVIKDTLPRTEKFIAALLEQFYKDTQAIDGIVPPTHRSSAVIREGDKYYLRNVETNKYLDVKDSALTNGQYLYGVK